MGDDAMVETEEDLESVEDYSGKQGDLIPLLQFFQKKYGYISESCVHQIARLLRISENQIYGVASFYSQFRFRRPGKNRVRVCMGTACHVQGGEQLTQEIIKQLNIHPGETTPDYEFEFEEVACLGCCAQAAVFEMNGKIHGKMTTDQLVKVLKNHE